MTSSQNRCHEQLLRIATKRKRESGEECHEGATAYHNQYKADKRAQWDYCQKSNDYKPVKYSRLTPETEEGDYMYVITIDDPATIVLWKLPLPNPNVKRQYEYYSCPPGRKIRETGKRELNHNNLAFNKDVYAAGHCKVVNRSDGRLFIANCASGHYKPEAESLYVVKCVAEKMGYTCVLRGGPHT